MGTSYAEVSLTTDDGGTVSELRIPRDGQSVASQDSGKQSHKERGASVHGQSSPKYRWRATGLKTKGNRTLDLICENRL